jgi:fumarate hydratase subunit alpha
MKLSDQIKERIIVALSDIGYGINNTTKALLLNAIKNEDSEIAKDILSSLIKNIDIAQERNFPLCQDTGLIVFYIIIGTEFNLNGIDLNQICEECVEIAFTTNNYRHSVVIDPINRINTKNNTPPIIHYEIIKGNNLEINIMLKGGGSENMSAVKMLKPTDGIEGVREFVIETVKKSGGNACPPLFVGVGIGGNFETCSLLAKKSLFNDENSLNSEFWQQEEAYLLNEINKLNIGPMGMGGITTALKVNINTAPCHIASLPVAVNLECHAHRVTKIVL